MLGPPSHYQWISFSYHWIILKKITLLGVVVSNGTVYRRYTDYIPGRQNLKHIEIVLHRYPISDPGRNPDRERYFDQTPSIRDQDQHILSYPSQARSR